MGLSSPLWETDAKVFCKHFSPWWAPAHKWWSWQVWLVRNSNPEGWKNAFPMHFFSVNLTSQSMVNAVRTYRSLLPKPDLGWQKTGNGSEGIPPATKSVGLQGAGKKGHAILKCYWCGKNVTEKPCVRDLKYPGLLQWRGKNGCACQVNEEGSQTLAAHRWAKEHKNDQKKSSCSGLQPQFPLFHCLKKTRLRL